jgi:formate dehydrogenase iron-sulfur subunit
MSSREPTGLLFDMVECVGCRNCVKACMESHGFAGDPERATKLSATSYTTMVVEDDYPIRNLCRHCLQPSCQSVCPVGALRRTDEGPVVYDATKCIGCRYCMVACPFNIPRYEWDKPVPAVRKCDMCIDRQREGRKPACAEACPKGATLFGTRKELLAEAWKRIRKSPRDYYPHVYGEHELGGTSVLFLAPHEVASLGYKASLGNEPLPKLTWQVLSKLPGVGVVSAAALMAIWWITRRRDEVALAEGRVGGNGRSRREEGK